MGQLGSIVTGFVDNMMVGHYSTEALAAASFCNNVFNMAILCCMGFTMGITPLVGALHSRRAQADIGATMRNAAWLNTLFCLGVMTVMTVLYFCVDRLGQPDELLPLIRPYYLTCLAGLLPLTLFNVFAQWSYGVTDTSMPMWIILGANVLNIGGNYALIFGHFGMPELGLTGAGISTFAARLLSALAIVAMFCMARRNRGYRLGWRQARITRPAMARLWHTSIPVSLQMTFETGSFSIAAVMCGTLGKVPLAAFQVLLIMGTLGFCVYYAIGAAVSVQVANANGRGDRQGMRRNAWAGYHVLLVIMTVSSLTFVFGGRAIIHAFTDDPAVISCAMSLIFPLVLYQLGDATQINFANALRGTANVAPMLWIAFASYMVVGLAATYLFGFTLKGGIYGIFLSFSVSLFMAVALFLYFFVRTTSARRANVSPTRLS